MPTTTPSIHKYRKFNSHYGNDTNRESKNYTYDENGYDLDTDYYAKGNIAYVQGSGSFVDFVDRTGARTTSNYRNPDEDTQTKSNFVKEDLKFAIDKYGTGTEKLLVARRIKDFYKLNGNEKLTDEQEKIIKDAINDGKSWQKPALLALAADMFTKSDEEGTGLVDAYDTEFDVVAKNGRDHAAAGTSHTGENALDVSNRTAYNRHVSANRLASMFDMTNSIDESKKTGEKDDYSRPYHIENMKNNVTNYNNLTARMQTHTDADYDFLIAYSEDDATATDKTRYDELMGADNHDDAIQNGKFFTEMERQNSDLSLLSNREGFDLDSYTPSAEDKVAFNALSDKDKFVVLNRLNAKKTGAGNYKDSDYGNKSKGYALDLGFVDVTTDNFDLLSDAKKSAFLKEKGYDVGALSGKDSDYGAMSKAATEAFKNGVTPDFINIANDANTETEEEAAVIVSALENQRHHEENTIIDSDLNERVKLKPDSSNVFDPWDNSNVSAYGGTIEFLNDKRNSFAKGGEIEQTAPQTQTQTQSQMTGESGAIKARKILKDFEGRESAIDSATRDAMLKRIYDEQEAKKAEMEQAQQAQAQGQSFARGGQVNEFRYGDPGFELWTDADANKQITDFNNVGIGTRTPAQIASMSPADQAAYYEQKQTERGGSALSDVDLAFTKGSLNSDLNNFNDNPQDIWASNEAYTPSATKEKVIETTNTNTNTTTPDPSWWSKNKDELGQAIGPMAGAFSSIGMAMTDLNAKAEYIDPRYIENNTSQYKVDRKYLKDAVNQQGAADRYAMTEGATNWADLAKANNIMNAQGNTAITQALNQADMTDMAAKQAYEAEDARVDQYNIGEDIRVEDANLQADALAEQRRYDARKAIAGSVSNLGKTAMNMNTSNRMIKALKSKGYSEAMIAQIMASKGSAGSTVNTTITGK